MLAPCPDRWEAEGSNFSEVTTLRTRAEYFNKEVIRNDREDDCG